MKVSWVGNNNNNNADAANDDDDEDDDARLGMRKSTHAIKPRWAPSMKLFNKREIYMAVGRASEMDPYVDWDLRSANFWLCYSNCMRTGAIWKKKKNSRDET